MSERKDPPPDHRSLFEKLQQQKAAKEEAFQEANRFSTLIRRLDNDEIDFLAGVQEQREADEAKKRRETERALTGFREAQRKVDARLAATAEAQRKAALVKSRPQAATGATPVVRRKQGITGVVKRDRKQGNAPSSSGTFATQRRTAPSSQPEAGTSADTTPAVASLDSQR